MTVHTLTVPPSDTAVDAWLGVLTAAAAADRVPAPSRAEVAGRLRVPPLPRRAVYWARDDGAGVASLVLFTDPGNAHTAYLDVLAVRPDARRRGVGTQLWERVRTELLAQGRTSISTLVDLGGPGQAFAESLGFENVLPMSWYVQGLTGEPAPQGAVPVPPGYELLYWPGLVPPQWADALAVAYQAMEDAPSGGTDLLFQGWTAQRVHAAQQLALDRGGELTTVAAVTPAGEVAAYTVLVLPDPADPAGPRGFQHDTVVVPAHRGRGLGRAVKRAMLADARSRHPALREIDTAVADENTPMRAVNAALGYRRERAAAVFRLGL
ncbi:N-acetyltransferase family protein [Streptomyces sp. NPDC054838]